MQTQAADTEIALRDALAPLVAFFANDSRSLKDFGQVADEYPMWGCDNGASPAVWLTAGDLRRAGRLLYGDDWNTCSEFLVGEWACQFLRAHQAALAKQDA